ncbi:MAG: NUMOD4 domain-containing protein [Cetobacterium sp.]
MDEVWRSVPGYEGIYEASDFGNVRSVDRIEKRMRYGKLVDVRYKGKVLAFSYDKRGYTRVMFGGKTRSTHRIIAKTFLMNEENKATVNHINEIKDDNRLVNLEWATYKENINHGTVIERQRILKSGILSYQYKPKSYYATKSTVRGDFKRICSNNKWNFEEFTEVWEGDYVFFRSGSKKKYRYCLEMNN